MTGTGRGLVLFAEQNRDDANSTTMTATADTVFSTMDAPGITLSALHENPPRLVPLLPPFSDEETEAREN